MKRLSSTTTFIIKKVFPAFWFGFLSLFFLFAVATITTEGASYKTIPLIVTPIVMAAFGYFLMKKLVFNLIDQVYDEGSTLLVVNAKEEVRISLKDIKNISFQYYRPTLVIISVGYNTKFGNKLSFVPAWEFGLYKKNKDVVNLIDRIDAANRSK
ncbi:MAG: hypothetical protein H6912_01620 [Kordiimonadaceae bacterium]|nr:hypothetical protein [Kordiimonadaceae bacterium]